jgi:uncharacterized membrane protein
MNRGYGFPPSGFRDGFAEHAGGPSAIAWVIFALVLVVLFLVLVSLILDLYFRSQGGPRRTRWLPGPAGPGRALAVLDVRYAQGELSREDYLQARGDLFGREPVEAPTEEVPSSGRLGRGRRSRKG